MKLMDKLRERRELRRSLAEALAELEALTERLREAYEAFNACSEPELLDAHIHEISALRCRCSVAVKKIKNLDGDKIKWQS